VIDKIGPQEPPTLEECPDIPPIEKVVEVATRKMIDNRVGMPMNLYLDDFGSKVWDAFGSLPYLVGSALVGDRTPNDVDVRMILDDAEWKKWGFGDPRQCHMCGKWVALCMAFSELGKRMTGLPVDFQLQQQTDANERNKGKPRSALGLIELRYKK
jgi:hypothetical protein